MWWFVRSVCAGLSLALVVTSVAMGQRSHVHYFHSGNLPPGTVGQGQLLRGGPLRGYVQPVEVQVPKGAKVSFVEHGTFSEPERGPAMAGMLIGPVYRLKITNIPLNQGLEVYPTIEVINRLYPPEGKRTRFPIPVQFTQEELELALKGNFVTRVIYLEDPNNALALREQPGQQRYFESPQDRDPLEVADQLGRPMAIMRMGSRVPDMGGPSSKFVYGAPPIVRFPVPGPQPEHVPPTNVQDSIRREVRDIPRIPLRGDSQPSVAIPGSQIRR